MWLVKRFSLLVSAFFVMAVVFGVGFYLGTERVQPTYTLEGITNGEPSILAGSFASTSRPRVDMAPFWTAWGLLESKYINADTLDRQDMVYSATQGMVRASKDPYTVFFTPEEKKAFDDELKGSFEGVGMEVGLRKNVMTVIAPLKDSPAERAGMRAGDRIISIDGLSTADMTVEEAVKHIRGDHGTKVKLFISPADGSDERTVEIVRDVIKLPILSTDPGKLVAKDGSIVIPQIPDDVFIISLHTFPDPPQALSLIQQALYAMAESRKTKLILDLRNNPGGYLESAVQIGSFFLPQGATIVEEDYGNGAKLSHKSYGKNVFRNLPMVILVNEGSASASEILAGALHDHGVAKLVGAKTFGKGSVQEVIPIGDASLKITVAHWLTPKGISISDKGIEPDYVVEISKEDAERGHDSQLEKAFELLKSASGTLQ
jgi:carboxyl-terminal processing protease